jgi:hypothetical protein
MLLIAEAVPQLKESVARFHSGGHGSTIDEFGVGFVVDKVTLGNASPV